MSRRWVIFLIIFGMGLLALVGLLGVKTTQASAPVVVLRQGVVVSGGGDLQGGDYAITATLGQAFDPAPLSGGDYQLQFGFQQNVQYTYYLYLALVGR